MEEWILVIGLTLMAGVAMPAGALLAGVESIRPNWLDEERRHGIIAFGGGALLSAVALVLVPEGIEVLPPASSAFWFVLGGAAFMGLDLLLYRINTPASQLAAMLSDFIPESIALGAAFAVGGSGGLLLACLMMLQNLPEGFNACRELRASTHYSVRRVAGLFALMALLGPVCGLLGYGWLAQFPAVVAGVMLFAAGGICYSVFQDIAPQAKIDRHWAPPMGAVLGFVLGMVGHQLTMA
ncbi:ZIP family metal transporter [Halopseudomonas pachastrellae]|uniref:ZIP family metal transporter n=1 Tax=Halopseudomonas pachastrellae TaxID=254161 RepID=UPI003D7E5F57